MEFGVLDLPGEGELAAGGVMAMSKKCGRSLPSYPGLRSMVDPPMSTSKESPISPSTSRSVKNWDAWAMSAEKLEPACSAAAEVVLAVAVAVDVGVTAKVGEEPEAESVAMADGMGVEVGVVSGEVEEVEEDASVAKAFTNRMPWCLDLDIYKPLRVDTRAPL
jgi:hypothetical protein